MGPWRQKGWGKPGMQPNHQRIILSAGHYISKRGQNVHVNIKKHIFHWEKGSHRRNKSCCNMHRVKILTRSWFVFKKVRIQKNSWNLKVRFSSFHEFLTTCSGRDFPHLCLQPNPLNKSNFLQSERKKENLGYEILLFLHQFLQENLYLSALLVYVLFPH